MPAPHATATATATLGVTAPGVYDLGRLHLSLHPATAASTAEDGGGTAGAGVTVAGAGGFGLGASCLLTVLAAGDAMAAGELPGEATAA